MLIGHKTTRDADLAFLEERRDRGDISTERLNALYHKAKNEKIETMRRALIEAHKRSDLAEVERIERAIRLGR